MIYGFINDQAVIDNSKIINLSNMNIACGYIDRDTSEFFDKITQLTDTRTQRLDIQYIAESSIITSEQISSESSYNSLYQQETDTSTTNPLYSNFDLVQGVNSSTDSIPSSAVVINNSNEMSVYFDLTKITSIDMTNLSNLTPSQKHNIFNIIEHVLYGTLSADTIQNINYSLTSNTIYSGYVSNSISIGDRTGIYIYGGINLHRLTPKYISFKFIVNDASNPIEFKLWFHKLLFKSQYPFTTIINIVPPITLNLMLDPSSLINSSGPMEAVLSVMNASNAILSSEMSNRDQSGLYIFSTRYVYNAKSYTLNFEIIYRGREPNSLEARNAVSNLLLSSGVGSKAIWQVLLPDLFYTSSFIIVPFYANRTLLNGTTIYPSICNVAYLQQLETVVSTLGKSVNTSREIMTSAYSKCLLGVAPGDVNEVDTIETLFPKFRNFSTLDTGWNELDNDTQEWAIQLNQALSVAFGETNLNNFGTIMINGLKWINFIHGSTSYLVLTKESYYSIFN